MVLAEYKEIRMDAASNRLGMPEERVARIAKSFLSGEILDLLKTALKEESQEGCRLHLHTIRGAAANVGLVGLFKFASEHEENIKNGQSFTHENFKMLETIWAETASKF